MSKISMALAFGAGYVFGSKAGRQRYEEITEKAKDLWESPKVQEQLDKAQEQAGKAQEQAKSKLKSSGNETTGKHSDVESEWSSDVNADDALVTDADNWGNTRG